MSRYPGYVGGRRCYECRNLYAYETDAGLVVQCMERLWDDGDGRAQLRLNMEKAERCEEFTKPGEEA